MMKTKELISKESELQALVIKMVQRVGQKLPQQNPLDQFIHNNLLMPFENEPFWEGVKRASVLYQGATTRRLEWYHSRCNDGSISARALEYACFAYATRVSKRRPSKLSESDFSAAGIKSQAQSLAKILMLEASSPEGSYRVFCGDTSDPTNPTLRGSVGLTPVSWPLDVFEWLCRLAETYLDQGMASWRPLHDRGILHFACDMLQPYFWMTGSWQRDLGLYLQRTLTGSANSTMPFSLELLAQELSQKESTEALWENWFLSLAFSLRGWSGMIHKMSETPSFFVRPRSAHLADWLFLLHCAAWQSGLRPPSEALNREKREDLRSQSESGIGMRQRYVRLWDQMILTEQSHLVQKSPAELQDFRVLLEDLGDFGGEAACRIWHEALEWSSYHAVMQKVSRRQLPTQGVGGSDDTLTLGGKTPVTESPSQSPLLSKNHQPCDRSPFVVLCCIDDREESLRRHLEAVLPGTKTYGVLGHFGVDMAFVPVHHPRPRQHCPPVVKPRRTVLARQRKIDSDGAVDSPGPRLVKWRSLSYHHFYSAKTLGGGVASALVFGNLLAFLLLLKGLLPHLVHHFLDRISQSFVKRSNQRSDIISLQRTEDPVYGPCGYTVEEQAEMVAHVLIQGGLSSGLSEDLVVVMGHTSTSVNNPFLQAYGCGACAGNSGGVNARVFSMMLNNPKVKTLLQARGVALPDQTVAVAALHDTTRESVTVYVDDHEFSEKTRGLIMEFERACHRALDLNAWERAPHLGLTLPGKSHVPQMHGATLRRRIHRRSIDLAQIRAEFGHSQTHYAYFGPRSSTQGISFERRSFLVSYHPEQDEDGQVLTGLIHGALPVVANITLDYFFSALDPRGFGSQNKVPLNVSAMIGLIQGSRGDLQVGLAEQMVEIHEPVRPLVFIEAPQRWIVQAILQHQRVLGLLKNEWIRLVQVCPLTKSMKLLSSAMTWEDLPSLGDPVEISSIRISV